MADIATAHCFTPGCIVLAALDASEHVDTGRRWFCYLIQNVVDALATPTYTYLSAEWIVFRGNRSSTAARVTSMWPRIAADCVAAPAQHNWPSLLLASEADNHALVYAQHDHFTYLRVP